MKKIFASIALICGIFGTIIFAGCGQESSNAADLVVYGKIFTAEDNQLAEAFAVKDGK